MPNEICSFVQRVLIDLHLEKTSSVKINTYSSHLASTDSKWVMSIFYGMLFDDVVLTRIYPSKTIELDLNRIERKSLLKAALTVIKKAKAEEEHLKMEARVL